MADERLQRARDLLGRRTFTELVAVLGGAKPAMRGACPGGQVTALEETARGLGLGFRVAMYGVLPEPACGGILHTGTPVLLDEASEMQARYFFIGADDLAAQLACIFDLADSVSLGRVLGYPDCCVEFFRAKEATWPRGRPLDLVPLVAPPTSGHYQALLNYACRHFGCALLSHFPCRWDCEGSLGVAEGVLAALALHAPDLRDEILDCLDTDVLYALPHVIAAKSGRWQHGRLTWNGGRHWQVPSEGVDAVELASGALRMLRGGREIARVEEWTWLPFHSGEGGAGG
jgi:hypothetical protein